MAQKFLFLLEILAVFQFPILQYWILKIQIDFILVLGLCLSIGFGTLDRIRIVFNSNSVYFKPNHCIRVRSWFSNMESSTKLEDESEPITTVLDTTMGKVQFKYLISGRASNSALTLCQI
ncbi:hypothetical protein BY458DRAFT_488070 [Sporodiniella umbellata]|nr:hypothetical protein BY458DRAFT_488070 [Sporodiniella umbellata]